jgi:hypothetical protein
MFYSFHFFIWVFSSSSYQFFGVYILDSQQMSHNTCLAFHLGATENCDSLFSWYIIPQQPR